MILYIIFFYYVIKNNDVIKRLTISLEFIHGKEYASISFHFKRPILNMVNILQKQNKKRNYAHNDQ